MSALDQRLALGAGLVLLWRKQHAHSVVAGGRQFNSGAGAFFTQKVSGSWMQDAGTVTGQRVSADSAAVSQVFQNLQALADNGMTLRTLDMGDEADATGIVFVSGIIQALLLRKSPVTHVRPL